MVQRRVWHVKAAVFDVKRRVERIHYWMFRCDARGMSDCRPRTGTVLSCQLSALLVEPAGWHESTGPVIYGEPERF